MSGLDEWAGRRTTAHSGSGLTREAGLLLRLTLLMTGLWILAVGSGASMYSGDCSAASCNPFVCAGPVTCIFIAL